MKRLRPGVYDDEQGGMHIDLAEMLTGEGWPDTAENRATLLKAAQTAFKGFRVTEIDAPVEPWVVWSFEHDAWWRPGRWGYTTVLAEAGRYSRTEAAEIVARANLIAVHEEALPLAQAEVSGPPSQRRR